jgi:cytidyltransferase-like protein
MKKLKIGVCHGVFDLVHYGHILHFKKAKEKVDKLIVSVTSDQHVNKGANRPFFNIEDRINFLKNIKTIDRVIISDSYDALNSLRLIKPNYYFKGIEYKNNGKVKFNAFKKEENFCKNNNIKIIYTDEKIFSSSNLLNNFSLEEDLKKFLSVFKKKYSFKYICQIIEKAKKKRISIIGDPIIDVYKYVNTIGTSSKSPSLAALTKNTEMYKGGSIAVAEMLANLGFQVDLFTFSNQAANKLELSKNIRKISCFNHEKFPTIERFIDDSRGHVKLLQTYNLENINLNLRQEKQIIKKINKYSNKSSFFLVIDFAFGFLTEKIIKFIDKKNNYSLNCHLNSLNLTSNYYSKYKKFNYVTFNKKEFEINFRALGNINNKIKNATTIIKKPFAITFGKNGSYFIYNGQKNYSPAIYRNIIDPVGCGDAFFSISSIIFQVSKDPYLANFIGNVYAGLHGMIICNKSFVSEASLNNTLKSLLS